MALRKQFLIAFDKSNQKLETFEWSSQLVNSVALVFGGMLIDQVSMRVCISGFFMLSVIGNTVLCIAGYTECWIAFVIGRIIFMIGTEMLLICAIITIVNMFYATGLNHPLGMSCIIPSVTLILCET